MTQAARHRGRFAPTPSGPLHFGSMLTAVASYVHARSEGGAWLLRMDDLDAARNVAGADSMIMNQLEAHGLCWDEAPRVQSAHIDEYLAAIKTLRDAGLTYPCNCTRRRLATLASVEGEAVYDGHCRLHPPPPGERHALRLRAYGDLTFQDRWQGLQKCTLTEKVGDFVILRADAVVAYQLACAVDEAAQGITGVVRGADLLASTYRQIYVQQRLGLAHARYGHLPVVVDGKGIKLSKQNRAAPVKAETAPSTLARCLQLLGQRPPAEVSAARPAEILEWAVTNWSAASVPSGVSLQLE